MKNQIYKVVKGARQVVSLLQNITLPSNKRTLHNLRGMSIDMVLLNSDSQRKAEMILYEHINMD